MVRKFVLACLVGAALASEASAAAPPSPPLRLLRLIEQLGHRDYRVRDQAGRQLLREGQAALPLLRRALGHRDAEVRRRALLLLPALQDAVLFAPKHLTLSVRGQTLYGVLEQLSKASGYRVVLNGSWLGGPDRKFTF